MKSRVIKSADINKLKVEEFEYKVKRSELQIEVDEHLKNEILANRYYVEGDIVENGSIVLLLDTETNTDFTVSVGFGVKDDEDLLVGKKVGDTVFYDGKTVKVVSLKKCEVPVLDDEFVKLLEVENVNTVSEYRAFLSDYYLRVYREGYSMYLSLEMFERWMKESTFHIDMTEVENLFKLYHEEALKIAKRKNEETDMESEREDFNYYLYFALFLNRELDDFSSPVKLNSLMEEALKPFRAVVEKHIKITLVEDN